MAKLLTSVGLISLFLIVFSTAGVFADWDVGADLDDPGAIGWSDVRTAREQGQEAGKKQATIELLDRVSASVKSCSELVKPEHRPRCYEQGIEGFLEEKSGADLYFAMCNSTDKDFSVDCLNTTVVASGVLDLVEMVAVCGLKPTVALAYDCYKTELLNAFDLKLGVVEEDPADEDQR